MYTDAFPMLRSIREGHLAGLLVCAVISINAIGLWPELSVSRVDLNDNVFHYSLIQGMAKAVERGANPLDFWSPEWSLGYPVFRTYQPVAHALVVLAYFALGKTVSLMTLFVWIRFLSVALLPLTFFAAGRLVRLTPLEAAAAALLAPLVSTNLLYGIEYGSYLWAGSGLFTQAVATHFLLLAIGFGFAALRRGRHATLAGILLGLTFLTHFVQGYIGAATICLLAAWPDAEVSRRLRARRTVRVAAVALLVSAFQLLRMWQDSAFVNHSRWEQTWKWDSFGAGQALQWLFTGELLDHGRAPILSLLALGGAAGVVWGLCRGKKIGLQYQWLLGASLWWILLFFGRPFWGPLLRLLGVPADMPLHRVLGGAQVFLVFLGGMGLAALWRAAARRHVVVTIALTGLLLYPMVRERAQYLANDETWGRANLAAYAGNRAALDSAIAKVQERGGRAYAGLAAAWGAKFQIGYVPFYAFLSEAGVPAVAFLYHAMALTGDIMVRFDERNPEQYRLFNIRSVVAPVANAPPLPAFLTPREQIGPFRIFDAPGAGYFDIVDAPAAVKTTRNTFYDVNARWLESDWVAKKRHLYLDFNRDAPPGTVRLAAEAALPAEPAAVTAAGVVRGEGRNGDEYTAELDVARPSFALFRMSWHPNWKAWVDGRPERAVMLSPGFLGVPVDAGRHWIACRYEAGGWELPMAGAGFLIAIGLLFWERFRGTAFPDVRWPTRAAANRATAVREWFSARARYRTACGLGLGLVLLASPVCVSLMTTRIPMGHDALGYLPRLVEFHQNISHGILYPRWAPDLSRGSGQPLFEFSPPMICYASELWHLAGFDFATSINLACAALALAAAVGMFLLGRLYFGIWAGWLAAAAYLYAPYFSVDLYVRSALSEFAAFPFYAFALYGFGAYAKHARRRDLLLGAAAYAGVLFSHNAAALVFTPLLVAFFGLSAWMARSWRVWRGQMLGLALGLGLSACVWLPAFAERQYVGLQRALEGYLRYSNHFVYLHQLLDSPWGYGFSGAGYRDGMSFSLGWSHVLLVVAAWWFWKQRDRAWLIFFSVAAAGLCAAMLHEAHPLWDRVPLLQYLQFPWRLLGPVAACVALLIAPLGAILAPLGRWRNAVFAGAMAVLIVPNLPHLQPREFRDVDLAMWTPRQLAITGFEPTTASEFVPVWVKIWPAYDERPVRLLDSAGEVRELARTPVAWAGEIRAAAAGTAEMQIAWFPGWEVRVDGQPVSAGPAPGTGLIRFWIPAGEHSVEASWKRTAVRRWADGLSLVSLAVLLGVGIRRRGGPNATLRK
jgi:hypothetical protein